MRHSRQFDESATVAGICFFLALLIVLWKLLGQVLGG